MAEPSVESAYENARFIHKVLSMYYDTDATQSDIARQLGISTPKVNRLLKLARRQGMVRISLHTPFQQLFDLEKRLEETFLIPEVVVLPTQHRGYPEFSICFGGGWSALSVRTLAGW